MTNPNGLSLDTATQAAEEGCYLRIGGHQSTLSIIIKFLKISGTVTGKVYWQGSNNGADYYTIDSSALVDGDFNYGYKEVEKKFLYYRANISQTGTSSGSYKGVLYTTNQ